MKTFCKFRRRAYISGSLEMQASRVIPDHSLDVILRNRSDVTVVTADLSAHILNVYC